jgi:hypothetical protein
VGHWFNFNEPQIFIGVGYQLGCPAPGLELPRTEVIAAAYNGLLARMRSRVLGWLVITSDMVPVDNDPRYSEIPAWRRDA